MSGLPFALYNVLNKFFQNRRASFPTQFSYSAIRRFGQSQSEIFVA
jgi:hypothetical protein